MITIEEPGARARDFPVPLFRYGFRPFFLGAGLHAAIGLMVWVHALHVPAMPVRFDMLWHAHEMIFGFAAAALAGFLLTAVPNWTQAGPVRGMRLVVLFGLWVAGRVAAFVPEPLAPLFAMIDIAFLPVLALTVGPGILMRAARRNGVLVAGVLVLAAVNVLWHAERNLLLSGFALPALHVALGLLTLMVGLVGGRIVPAFTLSGMRVAGRPVVIVPAPRLDVAALGLLAASMIAYASESRGMPVAVLALAAAVANGWRLARWGGWHSPGVPLVAILHVGYAWIVVALLLVALAAVGLVPAGAISHALGSGVVGTMVLAVMSRAALGHTGRALVASRATVAAYALVTLGAVARVVSVALGVPELVIASGVAWSAGFLVFALAYAPILMSRRPDGRAG
jgi:uncharacterized protein involved in response to NO